ncbi:hypothetical protein O1L68_13575 [Streptomyces lydicus]|nr:hypothetical protein [Streptomyces lydicus]
MTVTAVLDVMCAMGLVGVALVTGMTDVAHGGSRPGLGHGLRRDRRPGRPVYAGHAAPTTGPAGSAGVCQTLAPAGTAVRRRPAGEGRAVTTRHRRHPAAAATADGDAARSASATAHTDGSTTRPDTNGNPSGNPTRTRRPARRPPHAPRRGPADPFGP